MSESSPVSEIEHPAEAEQADDSQLECAIFRAEYRPSRAEASEEAVFAARQTMTVAHEAALKVLGITQTR
jgi:hypothetical protein